jgi:hypothetical protein
MDIRPRRTRSKPAKFRTPEKDAESTQEQPVRGRKRQRVREKESASSKIQEHVSSSSSSSPAHLPSESGLPKAIWKTVMQPSNKESDATSTSGSSPKRPAPSHKPVKRGRAKKQSITPVEESDAVRVQRLEAERMIQLRKDLQAMPVEMMRDLLQRVIEREPGLVFDVLDSLKSPTTEEPQPEPPAADPEPAAAVPWCICNHCRQMPTLIERKCCQCRETCLAWRPEMDIAILNRTVLNLAINYHNDLMLEEREEDENKCYRHQAYRQFVIWQHGRLGRGERRVLPSCVIWRIRDTFPDANGVYTGFKVGLFEIA